MIELVQWDSENFNVKVGNLMLTDELSEQSLLKAIKQAKDKEYDLLYLKGCELQTSWLSDKLLLADQKVVYYQTIKTHPMYHSENVISLLGKPMTKELLQLSYESGKYSRYHLDKNFSPSVFETLYRLWMEHSLSGDIATDVLAYQENGQVLGMLTYKRNKEEVDVGIVAVNPHVAGKGIGSQLMRDFLSRFNVGTKICVATQKCNTVACHYYEKNGFQQKSITNIYHIWLR